MIYVRNKNGKPLMPTKKCAYVRKLLKQGRAKVVNNHPFTIQLLYETENQVTPVILGIDPGRANIGVTAVNEKGETLFSAKAETRNKEIPKLMRKRKAYRQKHRQARRRARRRRRARANQTVCKTGVLERHLPGFEDDKKIICHDMKNKQARFSNRKRKDGWLTPTAEQLLRTHLNLIDKVRKLLPVSEIHIEVNKFAFLRLSDTFATGEDS